MSYRDRSRREPNMPKVIRVELSEKNLRARLIGLVILLAIAFTAIVMGVKAWLTTEPGWKVLECYAEGVTYSDDFVVNYYLGANGNNATAEEKAINAVFSQAMTDAYRIFTDQPLEDGTHNMAYLNAHLNETVSIEPALYRALELLESAGLRHAYLAPVYVEYKTVFLSQNGMEAAAYDPMKNEELMAYVRELAAYAADPESIRLELLGGGQVCLRVSDEYLAFIEDHEINAVMDLNWMTNAFVADFVADALAENGFTHGYVASYDGFTRNLGGLDQEFLQNIFARDGREAFQAGALSYTGSFTCVYLRDYPLSESDRWHYMAYEDGSITSTFLDPADGASKGAVSDLLVYSSDKSCGELLALAAPVMIADSLDPQSLLDAQGVEAIWNEGKTIFHTQPDASISLTGEFGYTLELVK